MSIKEVTITEVNLTYTIVLVEYITEPIFGKGKTKVRKAFKQTEGYIWRWLDTDEIISKSNALDAIVSTQKEKYTL